MKWLIRMFVRWILILYQSSILFALDSGAPASIAIGIYQELRTIPDNLISWKKYIIDPFESAGTIVHLYFSIRLLSPHDITILRKSLKAVSLDKYVKSHEFYYHGDDQSFVNEMREYIINEEGMNGIDPYSNPAPNPTDPLFRQYYARLMIGRSIYHHMQISSISYDLIMYLRSDLTFRFPGDVNIPLIVNHISNEGNSTIFTQNPNNPSEIIKSYVTTTTERDFRSLVLLDHLRYHDFKQKIAWTPDFEHAWALNDRYLILTRDAFVNYHANIKNRLIVWLANSSIIHGETINRYLVRSSTDRIYHIWTCYGVRRNIPGQDCTWTDYGDETCERMGMKPLSAVFGKPWLNDVYRAIDQCKKIKKAAVELADPGSIADI